MKANVASNWQLLLIPLLVVGCAVAVAPTESEDGLVTVTLTAFPDRISVEDSTATADIWATVLRANRPVADSTRVVFATTVGRITESSLTKDGLAIAVLTGPGDGQARSAEIVAQALAVRDTLAIDFVIEFLGN